MLFTCENDIWSIILSGIAILISIFSFCNHRKYEFNLKFYYDQFNDFLFCKIPVACEKLFDNNINKYVSFRVIYFTLYKKVVQTCLDLAFML